MARRSARGFTLLEMMMVVAIGAILAAMGGSAFLGLLRTNRANSTTRSVLTMLRSARTRAMTAVCPHFVQINGRAYAGPVGSPNRPATIYLVRKGFCASSNMFFEAGDRVMDSTALGPDGLPASVDLFVPATVVGSGVLVSESIVVGYGVEGALPVTAGQLNIPVDTGSGFSVVATAGPLTLTAQSPSDANAHSSVVVPSVGTPSIL